MRECSSKEGPGGPHTLTGVKDTSTCDHAREWSALIAEIQRDHKVDKHTAVAIAVMCAKGGYRITKNQLFQKVTP
jgi:hypothetical protein